MRIGGKPSASPKSSCSSLILFILYFCRRPDNSTPVNSIGDPWTQDHCAEACTAQSDCTAFVYGYESYESGGKDANVSTHCSSDAPACLFCNPDPRCHVPRCYFRSVDALTCGLLNCSKYSGGGHSACSMKADGQLISWGEFTVYVQQK